MTRSGYFTKTEEARKSGYAQKAKTSLHAALFFVGRHELLVEEDRWVQDVRADDPARLAQGLLLDLLLIDGDCCGHLPLRARRVCVFAWTPLARILRMSHQVAVNLQPHWFALQFPFHRGSCVRFTGKAPIREMPALVLPVGLGFAHLSLHRLLGALERSLRALPCGRAIVRVNQCMLPSSDCCQVSLPSCRSVFASVRVSETRLTYFDPAWFSCLIVDSL